MPKHDYADATGRLVALVPPGPERDELLGLVRLAVSFSKPRGPSQFQKYLNALVAGLPQPMTFDRFVIELALEETRRHMYGRKDIPVIKVDRFFKIVVYEGRDGRPKEIEFSALRNRFTKARKILNSSNSQTR